MIKNDNHATPQIFCRSKFIHLLALPPTIIKTTTRVSHIVPLCCLSWASFYFLTMAPAPLLFTLLPFVFMFSRNRWRMFSSSDEEEFYTRYRYDSGGKYDRVSSQLKTRPAECFNGRYLLVLLILSWCACTGFVVSLLLRFLFLLSRLARAASRARCPGTLCTSPAAKNAT